jgi:tRNA nucleotidyltransferase (CCA-adding enzyme)
MQIYLVGGAVRDQLLGIGVKDHDWLVVGAQPQQLLDQGYQQVGADFPVFLHPHSKEEYALARTERKSGQGYQGFDCRFSPDVTLEQDLLRRDLTINAMAMDENGNLHDPYNGRSDLEQRLLRHVSPAFGEDPLRVLRVARFAARFAPLGFQVADETMALMRKMVTAGELQHLVAERVWQETSRALGEQRPDVYFQVLHDCGALAVWFGEIDALFGVPQPPQHHPEIDCGIHALLSLQAAVSLSDDIAVRWAALTHDLGKALTPAEEWPRHIAHESRGIKPLKQLGERLKTPKDASELALLGCEWHTHVHRALELKAATIMKLFRNTDSWRRPDRFEQLLQVATADSRGRTGLEQCDYPQADYLRQALDVVNRISARDMVARGLTGKAIGAALEQEREQALQSWINQQRPSESDAQATD